MAIPSFIATAVRIIDAIGLVMLETVHWPEYIELIVIVSIKTIEAMA